MVLAPPVAQAALLGTCTIIVREQGTLTADATLTSLSSRNPGGKQAKATIIASGGGGAVPSLLCSLDFLINCFTVSVLPPSGFASAPLGMGSDISFSGSLSAAGSFFLLSKTILNGTYAFAFDLTATRTNGVFRAGSYQAQPTILCE